MLLAERGVAAELVACWFWFKWSAVQISDQTREGKVPFSIGVNTSHNLDIWFKVGVLKHTAMLYDQLSLYNIENQRQIWRSKNFGPKLSLQHSTVDHHIGNGHI
jgi:hypothetical protein